MILQTAQLLLRRHLIKQAILRTISYPQTRVPLVHYFYAMLLQRVYQNLSSDQTLRVDHSSPDENLRQEQAISRLMFVMLICYFTLWIPFSVSNIVYGVCTNCRSDMSFDEMNTFRWLAYSTCMLGPIIYGKFSEPIRQAYLNLFFM